MTKVEKRDDIVRPDDPWRWKYDALRDDGASHESALLQIECDKAVVAERKRQSHSMRIMRAYFA